MKSTEMEKKDKELNGLNKFNTGETEHLQHLKLLVTRDPLKHGHQGHFLSFLNGIFMNKKY